MRRALIALLALLTLLLYGCRGGVLVFRGTHQQQDEALLSKLAESYPAMSFTCTGQSEGAVHTVEDENGVQFPAWTAAKGGGDFQVLDYYLEEWLIAAGFYESFQRDLEEHGFSWRYSSYNHYEYHLQPDFGELSGPDRLEEAAGVMARAKAEFDSLRGDFQDSTGRTDLLYYVFAAYTYEGGEHSGMMYLSMREDDAWGRDYAFDDYRAQFEWMIDKMDKTPAID